MAGTITDRKGVSPGLGIKAPCRVATTGDVTLYGLQTIDGVALAADDRVLVYQQATGSENGIYNVKSTEWVRAYDFNGEGDAIQGTLVRVNEGSLIAGRYFSVTS